jgi:hypothetical protein
VHEQIRSLEGANAITSDMYYGRKPRSSSGMSAEMAVDELKSAASVAANAASKGAKAAAAQAKDWFNSFK